jgi:hypothetical protein
MPTNPSFPIGISNDGLICKFSDGQQLLAGGAPRDLSASTAAALLRRVPPRR